jgi:nitroreductase
MSNVQDNLNSRRTIYRFLDEEVNISDLESAFKAASNAPCHKQTHPWKFYVLGDETRKKLLPRVVQLSMEKSTLLDDENTIDAKNRAVSKIMDIPVIIAVSSKLSPNDSFREEEDYAATVCSLHNLVLSLWDLGLGSQWSTGAITRDEATYIALNISQENERIIGFLKVGYPELIPEINKKSFLDIRYYLP